MPLRWVIDENLRGQLWRHIRLHNARKHLPLDAVRVGDLPDLPLGADDPEIITWGQRENRILVSMDRATLARHLANHLSAGRHSPGIFLARRVPVHEIVEFLALASYASEPDEWANRIAYIP